MPSHADGANPSSVVIDTNQQNLFAINYIAQEVHCTGAIGFFPQSKTRLRADAKKHSEDQAAFSPVIAATSH
jgi:hypothetical protein